MKKFTTINNTLNKASDTITKINVARLEGVRDIINGAIDYSKQHADSFTSKKGAKAHFLNTVLGDDASKADKYFKRAVGIAYAIEVDGYKLKIELLSVAQMEQVTAFNKNIVNALMALEGDEYIDAVKALINTAKVVKGAKVFNRTKAKQYKA